MYFINLSNSQVQQQIKTLCRGRSGVYKIQNLRNGKLYIGSALTKKATCNRLYFRFRNHFFNHHKSLPLKRAIEKYGIQSFSWEILEFTDMESARPRESYYIETLCPEYNILQVAGSSIGYRHTPETVQKIKTLYSDAKGNPIGQLNKNKTLSQETRQLLSQGAKNRTEEQKQRHQEACEKFNQKMFSKATQVLDGESKKVLGNYPSLRQACRSWNGDYRTFKRAVSSGMKINKLNIYVKYTS